MDMAGHRIAPSTTERTDGGEEPAGTRVSFSLLDSPSTLKSPLSAHTLSFHTCIPFASDHFPHTVRVLSLLRFPSLPSYYPASAFPPLSLLALPLPVTHTESIFPAPPRPLRLSYHHQLDIDDH